MAFDKQSDRSNRKSNSRGGNRDYAATGRKKSCKFCTGQGIDIHYLNVRVLQQAVSERGKMVPRRVSGVCASHQRKLSTAVERARQLALLPAAGKHQDI